MNNLNNLKINTTNKETWLNQEFFYYYNLTQNQAFAAQILINIICKIALGLEKHLYLNNLLLQNFALENQKKLIDFWLTLQPINNTNLDIEDSFEVNLRDFLKLAFAELGVEIEFSGKNQYEKGVIIDVDEDIATKFGLNLEALKQGQTVVKLDVNFDFLQLQQNLLSLGKLPLSRCTNLNLQQLIKHLVETQLQIIIGTKIKI